MAVENGPSDKVTLVKDEGNFATYTGQLGSSPYDKAVDYKPGTQITFYDIAEDGTNTSEVVRQNHAAKSTGLRAGAYVAGRMTFGLLGGALTGIGELILRASGNPGSTLWNIGGWFESGGESVGQVGESLEYSTDQRIEKLNVSTADSADEINYDFHPDGTLVRTELLAHRWDSEGNSERIPPRS